MWDSRHVRYTCFLDANDSDTIATLKVKIQDYPESIPADNMMVHFRGKSLKDRVSLGECFIHDDCILHACVAEHSTPVVAASDFVYQWLNLLSGLAPQPKSALLGTDIGRGRQGSA